MKVYHIIIVLLFSAHVLGQNQQLKLNFEEGKDKLLQENLVLLAEYYNLDIAEANIQQASLWENPLFVWNAEMYSFAQNRYFNFANQKLIQLEYSFSVSGRRINAIKAANIQKDMAKLALSDVVRALIFEYSQSFYHLQALREKNVILEKVYANYIRIIELNEKKLELGIISESDLTRLKAENLALLSEISTNRNEITSTQATIHKLLNISPTIDIYPQSISQIDTKILSLDQLLQDAKLTRPDFLISQKNIDLYAINLKAEKSEAIPRINLGYQPLDNGSNYLRPYSGMVFEMAIPIFNRNQGNINAAKIKIDQNKYLQEYKLKEVENEVVSSYNQVLNSLDIYTSFNQELFVQMNELSENAGLNYERRNISLIEYIDFQRAFIENQQNWIEVVNNYQQQLNQLNFVVGKNVQL